MSRFAARFQIVLVVLLSLAALSLLGGITYAWFSSNRVVDTSKVTSKTASEAVELVVSSSAGGTFGKEAKISQVNKTEALFPVSTGDLKSFFYSSSSKEGFATGFSLVEDEKYYYHGRVYLEARAKNDSSEALQGRRMAVYLSTDPDMGSELLGNIHGYMANAGRLGLAAGPDGGSRESTQIFTLSDSQNPADAREENTKIGGVVQHGSIVLVPSGNSYRAAADPAKPLKSFVVKEDSDNLPEKPLIEMELNKVYSVDVYFYLEGCDPDCTNSVAYSDLELYLGFYGVMSGEGSGT